MLQLLLYTPLIAQISHGLWDYLIWKDGLFDKVRDDTHKENEVQYCIKDDSWRPSEEFIMLLEVIAPKVQCELWVAEYAKAAADRRDMKKVSLLWKRYETTEQNSEKHQTATGNKVDSEGVIKLSEALKFNSTLTSLNLTNNEIGTKAAIKLSEALKSNSCLILLNLNSKQTHCFISSHSIHTSD
jgi:hypothetical protein